MPYVFAAGAPYLFSFPPEYFYPTQNFFLSEPVVTKGDLVAVRQLVFYRKIHACKPPKTHKQRSSLLQSAEGLGILFG